MVEFTTIGTKGSSGLRKTDTVGTEAEPDTGQVAVPGMEDGNANTGKEAGFKGKGFLLNSLSQMDLGGVATGATKVGVVGTVKPG